MSWIGFECPKCGEIDKHVDKTENLKDWGLTCTAPLVGCGLYLGKGSYWLTNGKTIDEGWAKQCERLGWDLEGHSKE